jgi:hypothetical protein
MTEETAADVLPGYITVVLEAVKDGRYDTTQARIELLRVIAMIGNDDPNAKAEMRRRIDDLG